MPTLPINIITMTSEYRSKERNSTREPRRQPTLPTLAQTGSHDCPVVLFFTWSHRRLPHDRFCVPIAGTKAVIWIGSSRLTLFLSFSAHVIVIPPEPRVPVYFVPFFFEPIEIGSDLRQLSFF